MTQIHYIHPAGQQSFDSPLALSPNPELRIAMQNHKRSIAGPNLYSAPNMQRNVGEISNAILLKAVLQLVANFTSLFEKIIQLMEQAMRIASDSKSESVAEQSSPQGETPETPQVSGQESTSSSASTGSTPTSTKKPTNLDNSGEFLWKPISDKDQKLAILLPTKVSKNAKAVRLLDTNGKVIEKGTYSGIGNGNRAHFRFKKAGGSYPDNVTVEIVMNNGSLKRVRVPETSKRFVK